MMPTQFKLALALLAGSAALGWALAPSPAQDARLVRSSRTNWTLAELPRRVDLTHDAGYVHAANLWGEAEAVAPAEPIEDKRWRVAAIFGSGSDRRLLISFRDEARPSVNVRAGEMLPSGHKVVEIGEREYCVLIGKSRYRLGVEKRD